MKDYDTVSGFGLFLFSGGGLPNMFLEPDDFLTIVLFCIMLAGYLLIFYGLIGSTKTEKIENVFVPLRDTLKNKYYDEMADKLLKPEYRRSGLAGLSIMHRHSDFFSSPHGDAILKAKEGKKLMGENKLIERDIGKLASLSQDWMREELKDKDSVNDFYNAFLLAVNEKIKSPIRKYRGANYYLKSDNA